MSKVHILNTRKKKKTMGEFLLMILAYAIYPFYKLGLGIVRLWNNIVYEDIDIGSNGILGPGFRRYYSTRVAWGKITFILFIIFIIFYLIFG